MRLLNKIELCSPCKSVQLWSLESSALPPCRNSRPLYKKSSYTKNFYLLVNTWRELRSSSDLSRPQLTSHYSQVFNRRNLRGRASDDSSRLFRDELISFEFFEASGHFIVFDQEHVRAHLNINFLEISNLK